MALTKNLADELGPHGINVTRRAPGPDAHREDRRASSPRRAERQGITRRGSRAAHGCNNLVGRLIDARDIAYVVTFLASPKAVAINGDVIAAGGGARGSIFY